MTLEDMKLIIDALNRPAAWGSETPASVIRARAILLREIKRAEGQTNQSRDERMAFIGYLASKFFEWDGPTSSYVTLTSAKLFAEHCMKLVDSGQWPAVSE